MWGIPRRQKPDGAGVTRVNATVAENLMRPTITLKLKIQRNSKVQAGRPGANPTELTSEPEFTRSQHVLGGWFPMSAPTPPHTRTLSTQQLNPPIRGTSRYWLWYGLMEASEEGWFLYKVSVQMFSSFFYKALFHVFIWKISSHILGGNHLILCKHGLPLGLLF